MKKFCAVFLHIVCTLLLASMTIYSLETDQNAGVSNVTGQLVKELQHLFNRNSTTNPPLGHHFPSIIGPKPSDDVCIVGAGPAGIHMGLSLKKKGYSKIRIFEKSSRVGGKSYDVQLEGSYRAQGTIFLSTDYRENLVKLAETYDVGDLYEYPPPGVSKFQFNKIPLSLQAEYPMK